MPKRSQFLLYLKALIWSVFVSYTKSTVLSIAHSLREGEVNDEYPEFKDTHLGDCLRQIIEALPNQQDNEILAQALEQVKSSEPSMIYRNMVIEVGHYVTAKEKICDIPTDCPGVVYKLKNSTISVIFRLPDDSIQAQTVHPFQIMPVYTLTIPDSSS